MAEWLSQNAWNSKKGGIPKLFFIRCVLLQMILIIGVRALTLDEPGKSLLVRGRGRNGADFLTLGEPFSDLSASRTFEYSQSFYSIFEQRRPQFIFGERPEDLAEVETVDQKVWKKHRTYLARLDNFPLKKAAYYRQLQESTGIKSVRGLSEITGEDWSYIARVLKTLELPASMREYLANHLEPEIVKHFHLRVLLELARLGDENTQLARFREIIEEIQTESPL